jgi:hypothetical protein
VSILIKLIIQTLATEDIKLLKLVRDTVGEGFLPVK